MSASVTPGHDSCDSDKAVESGGEPGACCWKCRYAGNVGTSALSDARTRFEDLKARKLEIEIAEAEGRFTSKAVTIVVGAGRQHTRHPISPLISASMPVFTFRYGELRVPLRQSYRITRQCSGETSEVTDVKPDGVSRIVCKVVQLGRQAKDR